MADTGRDPFIARRLGAAGQGDPVGDPEADAVDFLRQPVRVFLDHPDGRIAIHGMDAARIRAGDAVRFQKQHQFPQLGFGGIRFDDHRQLLRADSLDLQQVPGLPLQNVQRFQAESRHHPLGHRRADSLDSAGTEKSFDGRQRRRRHPAQRFAAKLAAVTGVNGPGTRHFHVFARQRRTDVARYHNKTLFGFQAKNDIFVLSLEGDILDHTGQRVHRCVLSVFRIDYWGMSRWGTLRFNSIAVGVRRNVCG